MPFTDYHVFETSFGYCGTGWNDTGLARFILPAPSKRIVEEQLKSGGFPDPVASQPSATVVDLIAAVRNYFNGNREEFSKFRLDLTGSPPFHHLLYTAMRKLAYGETTTYGTLCNSVGSPSATRETGTAMGRNPLPLIIPCHRVLAAGGKIGGFSAYGGITMKQRMLALEKARPPDFEPAQASFLF